MRFTAYFVCILLFVASGAYGQEKQKKPSIAKAAKTKETVAPSVVLSVLSGQVFIVTKGRANIKLALVEVSAISEKDLIQYLKSQHSDGVDQQKLLLPQITSSRNEVSVAEAGVAQAELEQEELDKRIFKDLKAIGWQSADAMRSQARSNAQRLRDVSTEKRIKYRKLIRQFDYFDSAQFYFKGLPSPVGTSKTDADGKFALSAPAGKYVIAANSSRDVGEDTENYFWLVLVDTSSLPNQSVMLSNDNMFETKCKECVRP